METNEPDAMVLFCLVRMLSFENKLEYLERQVETMAYNLPSNHSEQWQALTGAILDTWGLYAHLVGKTKLESFSQLIGWLSTHQGTVIVDTIIDLARGMKEVKRSYSNQIKIPYEFRSPSEDALRFSRLN